MPARLDGWTRRNTADTTFGDSPTHVMFVELKEPAPGGRRHEHRLSPVDR